MHITPEFAGLLAQVYPALLIAILLEGKLPQPNRKVRVEYLTVHFVKFVAVLGGTISTFFCLVVAGSKHESVFFDWVISISGVAMFVSMCSLVGLLLGPEQQGALSLLKRGQKSDDPERSVTG